MKIFFFGCILLLPLSAAAQDNEIPAAYLRDSLPVLVQQTTDLLAHSYMAQTLLAETDSLPGWEGYPVRLYEYKTGNDLYTHAPKTAKVYLLNPAPEKLAMWIVTTCWAVKNSVDYQYTHQLFDAVRRASGAQFPVMGLVYEDQYTVSFQEPYVFKDGVTVYIRDSIYQAKNSTATPEQVEYYLHLTNDDIKPQTGQYARIVSTSREDYIANGGKEPVGNKDNKKVRWLEVVRELYKKAWHADKNELMIAWARQHLQ
ncbi:cellulase [Chitinophaga sp. MM2321]|uniref:cellulase n=1 Tax=Chitinophaga sp. MM2321 TaxID=3137178 RepID=UPI0032D591E2